MIIKWIGAACIVSACIGAGISIVSHHKKEVHWLKGLIFAIDYMERELQFRMPALPDLCRRTADECDQKLRSIFLSLSYELENQVAPDVGCCMESVLYQHTDIPYHTKSCLSLLGDSLGKFDIQGQMKALDSVKMECEEKLNKILDNANVRLRSYQTLGLCGGAALIILLM